jgi:hypothetical protein
MANLIKTVDVSSNNPTRTLEQVNTWVGQGCQLGWIHSYHSGEAPGLDQTTREWIELFRQAQCWRLPYTWLFRSFEAAESVLDSLRVFWNEDEQPALIALDCENYTDGSGNILDPGPTAEQILTACETARAHGVEPILYSNTPWLNAMVGQREILRGVPGWIANFNLDESLFVPAPDWVRVIGHQYTDKPEDWSVFDLDALTQLAATQSTPDPCQQWIAEALDYQARNDAREAQIDAARAYVANAPRVQRKTLIKLLSRQGFTTPDPASTPGGK